VASSLARTAGERTQAGKAQLVAVIIVTRLESDNAKNDSSYQDDGK